MLSYCMYLDCTPPARQVRAADLFKAVDERKLPEGQQAIKPFC